MSNWVYRRPTFPRPRQRLATVPVFFSEPGAMAGVATISFSETAALTSLQAIAGTAAITFSETAAPGVYASISGAEAITFSESGGLDSFKYGDITANEGIVFGETALLAAFRFGDMVGNEQIIFGNFAKIDDKSTFLPQPILPVLKPSFRAMDGKTLADNFNRGLVDTADYEWPNRRRFYQDDSPG